MDTDKLSPSRTSLACLEHAYIHSVYFLPLLSAFNVHRNQSVQLATGEWDVSRIHSLSALHPAQYYSRLSHCLLFHRSFLSQYYVKSGKPL